MESASRLIKRARGIRQLRQIELSQLSGVPASTISRIESGKTDPSYETVKKLLESIGFTGTDLQDGADDSQIAAAIEDAVPPSKLYDRYRIAAQSTPLQARAGVRAVTASLDDAVQTLKSKGVEYGVSAIEGVLGGWPAGLKQSYWPVIYVSPDFNVPWEPQAAPSKTGTLYIAPMTDTARSYVEDVNGTKFMSPDWSIIDAVASPGRQSDDALRRLRTMTAQILKEEQVS